MKKRNYAIDNLKGIMTLLVILGHVTMGLAGEVEGKFLEATTLQQISTIIYSFHMPVFFALSGFFWKESKQIDVRTYADRVRKKIIGLGIPYVVCSIGYVFVKYAMNPYTEVDTSLEEILWIPIMPVDFFWFLYSLILIYVMAESLAFLRIDKRVIVVGLAILAVGGFVTEQSFGLVHICKHAVYFYVGSIVADMQNEIEKNRGIVLAGIAALVSGYLYFIVYNMSVPAIRLVFCVAMTCFLIGVFSRIVNKDIKFITYIGMNSMPFYIMHYVFVGGTRIVMNRMGISNLGLHVIVGFMGSTILCYIIYRYIIARFKWMDFCFYPLKYLTNRKAFG